MTTITVSAGFGKEVSGGLVYLTGGFSPRYHLNRETGAFSFPGHQLDGQRISGKILVCDFARGGIAAGWALNSLKAKDFAPLAIVFRRANPVMVQGAIFAGIPIVEGMEQEEFELLAATDWITVNPTEKQIIIQKNEM